MKLREFTASFRAGNTSPGKIRHPAVIIDDFRVTRRMYEGKTSVKNCFDGGNALIFLVCQQL